MGIIIGGIVQLLWLDLSPVGVGIPYDATATTLLAVYWASLALPTGRSRKSCSPMMIAVASVCGFLFRWFDQLARRVNTPDHAPGGSVFRTSACPARDCGRGLSATRNILVVDPLRRGLCGASLGWGKSLWNRIAYSPRLTPLDQGLTMAALLLPVAGMGVTLELFLSDDPEGRWAPWRANKPAKRKRSPPYDLSGR